MTEERETKYVIAVDHGTTGMKVALADTCGEILGFEVEETPLYLFDGGGAEQDPDEWWNAFITATTRLIDRNIVSVQEIVAVCVSSQWSGTVAVDKKGQHLHNAIIWMDSRGEPYIREINEGMNMARKISLKRNVALVDAAIPIIYPHR